MLSRYLAIPFLLGTAVVLILALLVDSQYSVWIIPQVVVLAILYVLSPQIDWWYYKRRPPQMPAVMEQVLDKYFAYYRNLNIEAKKHFRNRLMMYFHAVEFIGKPESNVPDDMKMMTAANLIQLTFGLEDYRLSKFERIVLYPHPFPSPQFPEHLHNSEIYEEDGVLLFSGEHLISAFRFPKQYFNLALHEYAKGYMLSYPNKPFPQNDDELWKKISLIGTYNKEQLEKYIGLPEVDSVAVSIVCFFTFPKIFQGQLPELYDRYKSIFNQDPIQTHDPVIDAVDYTKF